MKKPSKNALLNQQLSFRYSVAEWVAQMSESSKTMMVLRA